mgnify:CR=1 FL=1
MQNNLINIIFVPEVSLSILAISSLMYGLFSKTNSFNKTANFATISLLFISALVYFDFTTNFALFENFFSKELERAVLFFFCKFIKSFRLFKRLSRSSSV